MSALESALSDLLNDETFMVEFRACMDQLHNPPTAAAGAEEITSTDPERPPPEGHSHPVVVFSNDVTVFAYYLKDPVRPDLYRERRENDIRLRSLVQKKMIEKHRQVLNKWSSLISQMTGKESVALVGPVDTAAAASTSGEEKTYRARWRKIVEEKVLGKKEHNPPNLSLEMNPELFEIRRTANSPAHESPPINGFVNTAFDPDTHEGTTVISQTRDCIIIRMPANSHDESAGLRASSPSSEHLASGVGLTVPPAERLEPGRQFAHTPRSGKTPEVLDSLVYNTCSIINLSYPVPGSEEMVPPPPEDDLGDALKVLPFETNKLAAEAAASKEIRVPPLPQLREPPPLPRRIWMSWLLVVVHLCGLFLTLTFGDGIDVVRGGGWATSRHVTPVNVWLGPSQQSLSRDLFALRFDCLVGQTSAAAAAAGYSSFDSPNDPSAFDIANTSGVCCSSAVACSPETSAKSCSTGRGVWVAAAAAASQCSSETCSWSVCPRVEWQAARVALSALGLLVLPLGVADCLLVVTGLSLVVRKLERHLGPANTCLVHVSSLLSSHLISASATMERCHGGWVVTFCTYAMIVVTNRRTISRCCVKPGHRKCAVYLYLCLVLVAALLLPMVFPLALLVSGGLGLVQGLVLRPVVGNPQQQQPPPSSANYRIFYIVSVISVSLALLISLIVLSRQQTGPPPPPRFWTATSDCFFEWPWC